MKLTANTPFRPVRDLIGEQVFHEQWIKLLQKIDDDAAVMLEVVTADYPAYRGLRQSRILASVVVWFGTNCGLAFLKNAEHFKKLGIARPYLAAWAIQNRRVYAINEGWRCLESICAEETDTKIRKPDLDALDYELVEHFMVWLGSDAGETFIKNAERQIHIRELRLSPESIKKLGLEES